MTTFKEIRGTAIEVLASDPSNPEIGQIWYNSTSATLKGYGAATVGWASAANLPIATNGMAVTGTQTAAVAYGGSNPSFATGTTASYLYNGTSWSVTGSLGTGRYTIGRFGTQTTAVAASGATSGSVTNTENFNGSAWTASGSINTGRDQGGGSGTQTAGLLSGGFNQGANTAITNAESYNGSTWTNVTALPTRRTIYNCSGGPQTATLTFGGYEGGPTGGPNSILTQSYNGSAWTTLNNLNTPRRGAAGSGDTSSAWYAGGSSPSTSETEVWNGTSWAISTAMPSAWTTAGTGPGSYGLTAGGNNGPGYTTACLYWYGSGTFATKTITVS